MAAALDSVMNGKERGKSLELNHGMIFFFPVRVCVKVWTGMTAVKVLTLWGCVSGL